ncbi:pyridoxamine 5'-phosphate oxidase [Aquirufa ecclesiirivi]|uniref:Pyridoxine/pyridoxamine 5'-phosphate oxidase n=1 Tax=Aquirufa ecclesiirivi TaxID=2715124 RepID=A0ABT4JCB4_9BACT|nr:pyridoxamine 5'-phosphate oxidase [Aquirufa ecclesiirivi]MCZ2472395.1 pyridoxamine 5'-phosphate oxidase [Aquirufa ecclesiirivi]MCZ2473927.1 pyridoxamine 5'-phosphate oxidase [Aquirufa ecclesiirivi]
MNLAALRENYQKGELLESKVHPDPLEQFKIWFKEAQNAELPEPNAMFLSTLGKDMRPSGRIVLLKYVDRGFSFFTNYFSRKGHDIEHHDKASITFFWGELERQVRIEGHVEKVDEKLSTEYFQSRPRASQIGAWVSEQSAKIPHREFLEERFNALEKQYEGQEIPKPAHWGGYELIPDYIEFWQGRPSRLHDRVVYELVHGNWERYRIAP